MKNIKKIYFILSYLLAFVVLVAVGFARVNIWVMILIPWIVPGAAVLSIVVWTLFLWRKKRLDNPLFKRVVFTNLWTMFGVALFLALLLWVLG